MTTTTHKKEKEVEKLVAPPLDLSAIENPSLPPEIQSFETERIRPPYTQLTKDQWLGALHATEVDDKKQQIMLRPYFAGGVFILLIAQNLGIWFIVLWALQRGQLPELQLIFSALIAGTLTQSYLILRFITNKVFSDIDYHNGHKKTAQGLVLVLAFALAWVEFTLT